MFFFGNQKMAFTFIKSDDEIDEVKPGGRSETHRPSRMGLGFTIEMFKANNEKKKEEKRLADKILGKRRKLDESDDDRDKEVVEDDSEGGRGAEIQTTPKRRQEVINLSKSQRKRLRLKNRK